MLWSERVHPPSTLAPSVFMGLTAFLLLFITTDVFPIVIGRGSFSSRLQLVLLLPLMAFIVLFFRYTLRAVAAAPELTVLTALAAVSFVWSYEPATTLERSIPLIITTGLALTLAGMFSLRKLIILFAIIGALSMVVSLAAIAAVPGARGIPPWENTWNGVYNHKNGLGAGSVLALIFSLSAMFLTKRYARLVFGVSAGLALLLLFASESRSPQIIAVFSLAGFCFYLLNQRFALLWAVGYFGFILAFLALMAFFLSTDILAPVFETVGRKPTLSGRLPIWSLTGPYIMDEFWLGYGYRGFWNAESARVLELAGRLKLGFVPYYSHNGIIEVWLHLGFIGFATLMAGLVRTIWACGRVMMKTQDRTAIAAVIIILLAFVLSNGTEGTILSRMSLPWMSFVAFSAKISLLAGASDRNTSKLPKFKR